MQPAILQAVLSPYTPLADFTKCSCVKMDMLYYVECSFVTTVLHHLGKVCIKEIFSKEGLGDTNFMSVTQCRTGT